MSERHEPMLSATCRAEQHQPDDVTHVCRWITHPGAVHNCNCGHSWEDSFEDRVLAGFAPTFAQAMQGGKPDGTTAPVTAEDDAVTVAERDEQKHRGDHYYAEAEHWAGRVVDLEPEVERLRAELDVLRQRILDIDAHATPYGDIPDDPGYVGTYLVTAGALHRALGKIGHTAPKCQAEAELARIVTEIEAEWEKIREAEGATARDESVVVGIYNGLGIALRIVRGES
jgi:hypothetical protein